MTPDEILRRSAQLVDSGEPCVAVTLVEATGSTPQDAGAKMIVTTKGFACGTVGGGRIEAKAIDHAAAMFADNAPGCQWVDWNLKADVGMTCGGSVKLLFELFGPARWQITMFGAGHVAQALARLLTTLPCKLTCIDPRGDWLAKLPPEVTTVQLATPADYVDQIPTGAQVLCMTQGHRSDLPVLQRLLKLPTQFPFVGVIGSKAKAAVLRKELTAAGVEPAKLDFHCPVGLPIGTNHPGEIAVSIAAQLLEVRDKSVP